MRCPNCGADKVRVSNSWLHNDNPLEQMVRRRRVCMACGLAWISDETVTRWTNTPDEFCLKINA